MQLLNLLLFLLISTFKYNFLTYLSYYYDSDTIKLS